MASPLKFLQNTTDEVIPVSDDVCSPEAQPGKQNIQSQSEYSQWESPIFVSS